jgi:hypothetical protein
MSRTRRAMHRECASQLRAGMADTCVRIAMIAKLEIASKYDLFTSERCDASNFS